MPAAVRVTALGNSPGVARGWRRGIGLSRTDVVLTHRAAPLARL